MSNPTQYYGFQQPEDSDLMSEFETYINGNWTKIEDVPAPPSITGTLPQSGPYNLYDRVYRTNDKSIYLLITKDPSWGWFWRPQHAAISPWISLQGKPIMENSNWTPSSALEVAHDNRGQVHWRGTVVRTTPMLHNTTEQMFIDLPIGLVPTRTVNFTLDVATPNIAGLTGLDMVQQARFAIAGNDRVGAVVGDTSVRLWGGNSAGTQPSTLYLNFSYSVGNGHWYGF